MLVILTPIIITPYISRVLGVDNVGVYNYAFSIVNYYVLFGCVGLNLYGQREIAYVKNDKTKVSKIFYELQIVRLITISIALIIYYSITVRYAQYPTVYMIFGLEILASLFDVSWFFQGLENFKMPAIRTLIIKGCFIVSVFVFVKTESDLTTFIFWYAISLLLGNLSLCFSLPKELIRISLGNLNVVKHLRPIFALFLPQIATNVYTQLDKTMTGLLTGHNYAEVTYYSQAESIVKIAMTVITAIGGVMLSRVATVFVENDMETIKKYISKSFRFMFFLAWPMVIGIALVAEDFVPWFFGEGYDGVVPCMIALAPLVLIIGVSNIFGTQYLLPTGKTKLYTISVLVGMCVNIALNFLLIPRFYAIGAVIATLLAEISVSVTQYIFVKDTFSVKLLLCGWKNAIMAIIMGVAVYFTASALPSTLWATIVEIVIGGIIYFALYLRFDKKELFTKNMGDYYEI